ncbi:MAG: hypothetical protein AAFN93_23130, partial [Bacteroidota bacterium]
MGQLAVSPGGHERPSIGELRKILKNLNCYLEVLGDIGEELPNPTAVEKMTKSLKKFNRNLKELRKNLRRDRETCKELHNAIIKIETDFNEKNVLANFSMFLRRLKQWNLLYGNNATEEELENFRIRVRGYFEDFKDELEQAIENR